jgi:hypothetical protein
VCGTVFTGRSGGGKVNVFFWVGFAACLAAEGIVLALLIVYIAIAANRDAAKYHDSDQGDLP